MEQHSEEDLLRKVEEVLFRVIEEGPSLAHEAEEQPPSQVEQHDSGPAAPSALAVYDHNAGAVRCVIAQDALSGRYGCKAGSREVLQAIGPVGRTHYLVRRVGDQDKAEFLVPLSRLEDYVFFADAETARKYRF